MEVGVGAEKMTRMKDLMMKKRQNAQMKKQVKVKIQIL